ncbi:MAG: alpha/beta hydrolase [Alphaproteobacteria bacterium]|nr:MAG: alpha/beta hydrolase [Alphaproteobacteria bacterium]
MNGSKATALAEWAQKTGHGLTRFDYSGHGQSDGKFIDGTIGQWIKDALYILDNHTVGKKILVGSSMGGWITLHLALLRPERVAGLVGIASAPDFTEELIWNVISEGAREKLLKDGVFYEPPKYDTEPTPFTKQLIEDGRKHLLLARETLPVACPVRLIHGMNDVDVPWEFSRRISEKVESDNVQIHLIKDGDHRLSRPQDIDWIFKSIEDIIR